MAFEVSPEDALALITAERRRRQRERSKGVTDPLARLLDPAFTDRVWIYEDSKIGPELPGSMHAKQTEAWLQDSLHKWLFWSNQSGKTTEGGIETVAVALGRHPLQLAGKLPMPPIQAWASALSWELWQNVLLPELLTWLPVDRVVDAPTPFRASMKRDILVKADNGSLSRITGKAAEQGSEKYQAARVHWVWLDEEHPEAVWNEMQPRLARFGGRTLATMTPLKGESTYVFQRIYEPCRSGRIAPERHWYSHCGMADNPGISPARVHELEEEFANTPSQLAARLYGKFVKPTGVVYQFDIAKYGIDLEGDDLRAYVKRTPLYGLFDLGKWRFAFAWGGIDDDGLLLIDEVFSQNESSDQRAKKIHDQLTKYGVKEISIWGECADPQEVREINEAFDRLDSPFRFYEVGGEKKNRKQGVTRVESMINRGALRVCRAMGRGQVWRVGMSAATNGAPMEGSRWVWEANNWQYPVMPDGKVQTDDPDDATADGADMMDGTRYLCMQVYGPLEVKAKEVSAGDARLKQIWADLNNEGEEKTAEEKYGSVLRQG